eukprot:s820_g2.t1
MSSPGQSVLSVPMPSLNIMTGPDAKSHPDVAIRNAKSQDAKTDTQTSLLLPGHEGNYNNAKKRPFSQDIQTLAKLIHFKDNEVKKHTPRTFGSLFAEDKTFDSQLFVSNDALKIAQDPAYLPPAKRAKVLGKTPLEVRTFTPDETIPVIMAAYGRQHKFSKELIEEKGCLIHFLANKQFGVRYLHPIEIAKLHGVTSRFFAHKNFTEAWQFLGNQITPFHAMIVLTGACAILPDVQLSPTLRDVYSTWEFQRLKNQNAFLTQGSAGYVLRHMRYDDDITPAQHVNLEYMFKNFANGLLPEHKWWDLDGLHDMPSQLRPQMSERSEFCHDHNDVIFGPPSPIMTEKDPSEVSETMPFRITIKAVLHLAVRDVILWVASDVQPTQLAAIWKIPCDIENRDGEIHMFPKTNMPLPLDHTIVTFMLDNKITLYAFEGHDYYDFCHNIIMSECFYDQFGQVQPRHAFFPEAVIVDRQILHGIAPADFLFLIAAWQNCTVVYRHDGNTDQWICNIAGDVTSRHLLAKLFSAATSKDSLHAFGRILSICHEHDTKIIFAPAEFGTPIHATALATALAILLTRTMLDSLQTQTGVNVQIKWQSRILWQGRLEPTVDAEIIKTALMYALSPFTKLRAIRLIHEAKQFAAGPIGQCQKHDDPGEMVKLHVSYEMCGGGGPASTKGQLRQQVRNSLAAWMLESGQELSWINSNLEEIIDNVGIKKFVPVIQQPASNRRDSQLQQILVDASVKLPEIPAKIQRSQNTQKAKLRRRDPVIPEPTDFKIDCSFLLKEDGTAVTQMADFKCNQTGVHLTNATGALPWLRENQQLSADELALLVLGPLPVETTLPHAECVVPCLNSAGQQVLLQTTMVQFGAKKVKAKDWDQTSTKATTSRICALTLWQQDWSEKEWQIATTQTTQFVKDVFALEGLNGAITSVWGRSYRRGKQPTTYKDATSIQVHAAIIEDQFLPLLRLTGYNRIWAAPKAEDGRLTDDFRILWLPAGIDIQKASALTAKLSGVSGLVRGKSSLGARVASSSFATAWSVVYPSEPAPADVSNKWVYKLEPLPYGCNSKMLTEWSQHVKWPLRPLRATGPKSWLVCTDTEPPEGPLAFNGNPVLPRYMPQRHHPLQQPIIAGPRATATKASIATTNNTMSSQSGGFDPWMTYHILKGNNPMSTANASVASVPAQQGPVENRLAQQDAKVQELEQKIEAIQTQQTQHSGHIQKLQTDLVSTEQRIVHTMNQSMQGVKTELSKSFGEALGNQTKQFEASMLALRQALLETKRKKPEKGGEEMSD